MKQSLFILLFSLMSIFSVSAHSGALETEPIWTKGDPIEIRLFPNPASHYFEINTTEEVSRIEIFNLLGRKMMEFDVEARRQFDISELPNGMYLVQVFDAKRSVLTTRRLQKR